MPLIKPLHPALVNKIAAGEVIERPASVVKELTENALDAGATRVEIALEDGGSALIRVSDNGCGIPSNQLPLAVAPHATSKIENDSDLFAIRSFGFRGEALASIASVSHLRIVSRTADQTRGSELIVDDQGGGRPEPCAAPIGTTVEIRQLFFNVPARRKFLRQAPTEFSHATEQIARLALAHPTVAFVLSHNGRMSRTLPATTDRRTRIADFYGADLADCLLPIVRDERGLRIEALIAPPAHSRATTKWQYIFLNGRFIADRRIGFSIREAFRGLVEHDRFPVVFLFLTTPPDVYDVNVHPTKIEVRWRDAGLVQSQVLAVLRETLLSHDLTPPLLLNRAPAGASEYDLNRFDTGQADQDRELRTRQALADYLKSVDPGQTRLTFPSQRWPEENVRASIGRTFSPPSPPVETPPERHTVSAPHREHAPAASLSETAAVLQVHNTYLVAQTEEGIVIIDQHALHERILYERFRERILAGSLESQRLLMPATLEAAPARAEAAEHHRELLARLGIEVGRLGPGALAVQSFPTLLPQVDVAEFVSDLLDRLAEQGESPSDETVIHASIDMMACKAAVKAGDPLTAEEMQALLAQRHLVQKSSNCPHGRPTTLQLTTRDLERQFKRT